MASHEQLAEHLWLAQLVVSCRRPAETGTRVADAKKRLPARRRLDGQNSNCGASAASLMKFKDLEGHMLRLQQKHTKNHKTAIDCCVYTGLSVDGVVKYCRNE